jgi:hypothetical protein
MQLTPIDIARAGWLPHPYSPGYYIREGEVVSGEALMQRLTATTATTAVPSVFGAVPPPPHFKRGDNVIVSRPDGHGINRPFHYGEVTRVLGREGGGYEYEIASLPGRFPELRVSLDVLPFLKGTIVREFTSARHGIVVEPRTITGLVGVEFPDGGATYCPARDFVIGLHSHGGPEAPGPCPVCDTVAFFKPFKPGDRVRVKHPQLMREGEPEVMTVAKIGTGTDSGIAEMEHELQPGMPAPWRLDYLERVVEAKKPIGEVDTVEQWGKDQAPRAKCLRCGAPAYEGLFSSECLRPGGCATAEERVAKRMPLIHIRQEASGEMSWSHDAETWFPSLALAQQAARAVALTEERGR